MPNMHKRRRISGPSCSFKLLAVSSALQLSAAVAGAASADSRSWTSGFEAPRANFLETVLEGNAANQKSCKPTGLIQDACCDYQTVEEVNDDLAQRLGTVIQLPFFRYQRVDLFRECPYWREDGSCMNRACAVQETEENEIPEAWRTVALGQVKEANTIPVALREDANFCVLDEESGDGDGVYVDLFENPERFTGYAGHSANRVWKAIYEENCFGVVPFLPPPRGLESGGSGYVGSSFLNKGNQDVGSLMGSLGLTAPRDPQAEEQCLEKRVFYRLISGLHASISIHICAEYLDKTSGEWRPNLECFITRIAEHPERLQNVYFNYVLMLRALTKAAPYLRSFDYSVGNSTVDERTQEVVRGLLDRAVSCTATFDETSMFASGPDANILKAEFKKHFRNVSQIMDCVGCDKCRLWGKTQVTGLATALKLLFSFDESAGAVEDFSLRRSEVVAFIWTLHRFSESLAAVEQFRNMWTKRNIAQSAVVGGEEPEDIVLNAVRSPTQQELQHDAIPLVKATEHHSPAPSATLAEPAIFSPPSIQSIRPEAVMNASSYKKAAAESTAMGPILSGILARLYDTCRTHIIACLALFERGVAFVTSQLGSGKVDL